MYLFRYISECTSLDPTWDYLNTETSFPIVFGTVVEITCETGYSLQGSNTVTCDIGTTYKFVEQPACKLLGKFFSLPITVFRNLCKYYDFELNYLTKEHHINLKLSVIPF